MKNMTQSSLYSLYNVTMRLIKNTLDQFVLQLWKVYSCGSF